SDIPLVGHIKLQQELHQGGLATATGPHYSGHFVGWNGHVQILDDIFITAQITKGYFFQFYVLVGLDCLDQSFFPVLLVFLFVDLGQTLHTDLRILIGADKPYYLSNRGVQLSNDVLDGEHHPQGDRSEEHTSELQSRENIVCRLLLEKQHDKYSFAKERGQ